MTWIAAFVVVALLPGDARAFSCGSDVCTKNVHVCCKSSEGSTHTCETPIDCAPEFWTKGLQGKTTFYCGIGDCSFGKVCCKVDNDSPNCKSTEECPLERWQMILLQMLHQLSLTHPAMPSYLPVIVILKTNAVLGR